jgi:RNA polymerase-binding transcription factor DksA
MEKTLSDRVRQTLLSRREKIVSILTNLQFQRVDLNKRELLRDDATFSRTILLDALDGWYHKELQGVDSALARTRDNHFGICFGCNSEIDQNWLERCPEAEFCRICEGMKRWMEVG